MVKKLGAVLFKNNSQRLANELNELVGKNPELHNLLFEAANYCYENFGKDIVLTMITRTQEEQDELYKNDAKYQLKKFKSPHQFDHAFDLRSSVFDTEQKKKLVDYLNLKYNSTNYYNWTAKCHDIDGTGPQAEHFHVQFAKK